MTTRNQPTAHGARIWVRLTTDRLDTAQREVAGMLGQGHPLALKLAGIGDSMREIAAELEQALAKRGSQ